MGKKKCGGVYGVVPAAVAFAGTGCWDESPRNLTEGYIGTGSRGTEGPQGAGNRAGHRREERLWEIGNREAEKEGRTIWIRRKSGRK